ncbi:MAG: EAL domain-containing protein [Methylotenera sp.]|nr:EAL domain-containing protein [Methylotenera sp.]
MRLLKLTPPVEESMLCLTLLDIFTRDPSVFAIPVVNPNNEPTGIVDRHTFFENFIKPFAKEVHGKTPISNFMNTSPIIVDKETTIDDIAKIIIDAGMQHMVSGFIATHNHQYLGIANGHDLLNEITQRKQANLFYLAHFDQLTMLPNRLLFIDRLDLAISDAARHETQIGLLYIDLDNFKNYNDSMGHSFGDKLLTAVAQRLSACARDSDTVARLSGDEFTIFIESLNCVIDLKIICNRITDSMKMPLHIMDTEFFITVSIGTAIYPIDAQEPAGLLVKADAAMYEAKHSGRNSYRNYTLGMDSYSFDHLSLETDLRMAIERKEFVLFYQPQMSVKTGEVTGVEALVRWNHPERGLLTPFNFIEIAEETGLIFSLGDWVLEEACRQHMAWINSGLEPIRMSINISVKQFYKPEFSTLVKTIVKKSGIKPSLLELELTESLCMHHVDSVLNTLHELHVFGIKLAIDDFGTGYSNLSYLRRFPVDRLKIDQSFIRHIDQEPVNIEIVRAIVALGKSMSLELVAEGVETANEYAWAKSLGCEFVQGYLFSKPLSLAAFEHWLESMMVMADTL